MKSIIILLLPIILIHNSYGTTYNYECPHLLNLEVTNLDSQVFGRKKLADFQKDENSQTSSDKKPNRKISRLAKLKFKKAEIIEIAGSSPYHPWCIYRNFNLKKQSSATCPNSISVLYKNLPTGMSNSANTATLSADNGANCQYTIPAIKANLSHASCYILNNNNRKMSCKEHEMYN